jgi:high-affinity iron transporter
LTAVTRGDSDASSAFLVADSFDPEVGFMSAFVQALVILLREGLEALLVIAALGAYLSRAGQSGRLTWLYAGAGLAVIASLITAWAFETFNNGVHNDIMEGVVILCAAALMLYVSGWLFLRQDPRAWQGYLKQQADKVASADRGGLAAAALAFLAVFREGAETILFIHALAKSEGGWSFPLIAGLILAGAALVMLFFAINLLAHRLPLRPVFVVTSAMLFLMAIKFIGDAIQEFQEQLILPYDQVKTGGQWLLALGLNPTIEALTAQAIVIALAIATVASVSITRRRAVAHHQSLG